MKPLLSRALTSATRIARAARLLRHLPGNGLSLLPLRVLVLRASMPGLTSRRHLEELLEQLTAAGREPSAGPHLQRVTERLVRPLGRWRTTCLYRSLTRYGIYRAAGMPVAFVIGVRIEGDEPVAHAWLERDGRPFEEPAGSTEGFSPAFQYPPAADAPRPAPAPEDEMRTSKDALLTELKDGTGVLLDLKTKFYFTLNRTGVFVWKQLSAGAPAEAEGLAEKLAAEFSGVDLEVARGDIGKLLAELAEEGLLVG